MRKVQDLGGLGRFTPQLLGGSAAEAVALGTWFWEVLGQVLGLGLTRLRAPLLRDGVGGF